VARSKCYRSNGLLLALAETRRIDVGGHHLRTIIRGAGPPYFVCLHGLADTLEIWSKVAGPLAARGRVVLVDQRGHGESEAPPGPYRREDLAVDVRTLLDRLDIPQAVLVGHSMGGIVAMTAALAYRDRLLEATEGQ
jgi:3-oxoadipate enol-lactonase